MTSYRSILAAGAGAFALAAAGAASAQTKTLYVGMNGGNFEKTFTQGVFPEFEKANNVKVVVVPGTSSDILAKATAAKDKPNMMHTAIAPKNGSFTSGIIPSTVVIATMQTGRIFAAPPSRIAR